MLNKSYAELDKLFSEFIRRRAMFEVGGCQRCLTAKQDWKELQCSHFIGRSRKSVRFDEANAIGICGACHIYFHSRPLEFVEWFKQRLGEEGFNLLLGRARITYPKPDKELIKLYLQERLRELDNA